MAPYSKLNKRMILHQRGPSNELYECHKNCPSHSTIIPLNLIRQTVRSKRIISFKSPTKCFIIKDRVKSLKLKSLKSKFNFRLLCLIDLSLIG